MTTLLAALDLHSMLLGISWMDPTWLLDKFGGSLIWISLVIVFVECGLFFPFLPGDTLLFGLGLFIAGGQIHVVGIGNEFAEMVVALVMLTVAAFLGNVVGYEIGRKIGPPITKRDGRFLKQKYFEQTSTFFDRHGNKALVIGRFVPFVRTFITVVAGVTKMDRRRFFTWSAVGATLWVASILLLGFFLGSAFPSLGNNIDLAILAITAFSIIPVLFEWWRHEHNENEEEQRQADEAQKQPSPDDATGRDLDPDATSSSEA
ncbi:DedA family protein [Nocardioides sp.]|uniref:DedA family protein n=1 Tax=Nocardioides sp. TaxID=35761 RepID=UPI0031FEDAD4